MKRQLSLLDQALILAGIVAGPLTISALIATRPDPPDAPAPIRPGPTPGPAVPGNPRLMLDLTNAERRKAGLSPYVWNAKLAQAAQWQADDNGKHDTMTHAGSDGSGPGDRATRFGYRWSGLGENAFGVPSNWREPAVLDGWMHSPGHRENILNPRLTEGGVGVSAPTRTGQVYWIQLFGRPG